MSYWTFKYFHNDQRINLIEVWLADLPIEDGVKIERIFAYVATIKDKSAWKDPFARKLKGIKKGSNIWEIRINSDRVLYRPLGCFGPKEDEFTLLIGATEKSKGVFEPRRATDIAVKRCKLIHQDRRYVGEYD
jgi:hypothetical protein